MEERKSSSYTLNHGSDYSGSDRASIPSTPGSATSTSPLAPLDEVEYRYGWFSYTPDWLQFMCKNAVFIFFGCIACIAQTMVVNGLIGVSISSWETRFNLSSSQAGLVSVAYELSAIPILLLLGFFGPRLHRLHWISGGMVLISLGSLVFAIPHFTTGEYEYSNVVENNFCNDDNTTSCSNEDNVTDSSLSNYLLVFIIGAVILSLGTGPLYILGIPFIDDTTTKEKASLYLGLFYAMAVLGPALGYICGGLLLTVYTDFHAVDMDTIDIDPSDPRWVGAWWIGFLIVFVLAGLVAIPLSGYPNYMPGTAEIRADRIRQELESDTPMRPGDVGSCSEFPAIMKNLFTNGVFILSSLAYVADAMLIVGFAVFGPKYLENQFSISAGQAGAIFGITAIPGGAGGTILGGWIIKRWRLDLDQMLKGYCACAALTLLCAAMFLIQCPNPPFAGVTYPEFVNEPPPEAEQDLYFPCNQHCDCSTEDYEPVCGSNDIVYFSPCFAGCTGYHPDDDQIAVNCSCVLNSTSPTTDAGLCSVDGCDQLWVFIVILVIAMLLLFVGGIFHVSIVIRCVPEWQRALAVSVDWVLARLCGAVPAPFVFGAALDTSCVLWEQMCDDSTGSCLYYDNSQMAWYMLIVCACAKLWCTIMSFCAWAVNKACGPQSGGSKDADVEVIKGYEIDSNGAILYGDSYGEDRDVTFSEKPNELVNGFKHNHGNNQNDPSDDLVSSYL